MRGGFKIFDSDTHLNPNAETLGPYFDAAMRKRLPEWENCKIPFRVGWAGEILQPPYRHRYQFKKRAGWREELRVWEKRGRGNALSGTSRNLWAAAFRLREAPMTTSGRAFAIWTRKVWTFS
jgi:hypothetical protein